MSERAIITGYALADMDERRKLEAEVEMQRRDQTEFIGAALCALGVNRDESVAPGNQILAEIERLRGLLKDADEAIREAPIETDGSGCFKGRANDWFDKPAVRRALGEIGEE